MNLPIFLFYGGKILDEKKQVQNELQYYRVLSFLREVYSNKIMSIEDLNTINNIAAKKLNCRVVDVLRGA